MSNGKELTREILEEIREYRNVEWAEDELTRFHDFLEESGLAARLRQPGSIDQVLAEIFPARVDNSELQGRDRIEYLMDCMVQLVEDVVREHMGVSDRSSSSTAAAAAAAAAAAIAAATQVGPSASSSWPADVAEQSDDIYTTLMSASSPSMPSMDDLMATAASPPANPLPDREPAVDLNHSTLMEAIDRYDRSLDQSAGQADSRPSSSSKQWDPLLSSPSGNFSTTTDDSQQRRPRLNYYSPGSFTSMESSLMPSADNRDSYVNVGRGEATPSSSGNRQRLGEVTPSSSSSRRRLEEATPTSSSCRTQAATLSSSGRRRKASEWTPSTDMGGMCLDTPTSSKRRMLRRQRSGLTTRPPPLPIPSLNSSLSSTRPTLSTPPLVSSDENQNAIASSTDDSSRGFLAPRALVWSYQEEDEAENVPADQPPALDGDGDASAAAAPEAASESREVPDTTSEQPDDKDHRDAPRSRWAELISAMEGSQVAQKLTGFAADVRTQLGIDFSVNETMDKLIKQIKLKALLRTVYRFFHEENSNMKDLFEENFEKNAEKK